MEAFVIIRKRSETFANVSKRSQTRINFANVNEYLQGEHKHLEMSNNVQKESVVVFEAFKNVHKRLKQFGNVQKRLKLFGIVLRYVATLQMLVLRLQPKPKYFVTYKKVWSCSETFKNVWKRSKRSQTPLKFANKNKLLWLQPKCFETHRSV